MQNLSSELIISSHYFLLCMQDKPANIIILLSLTIMLYSIKYMAVHVFDKEYPMIIFHLSLLSHHTTDY